MEPAVPKPIIHDPAPSPPTREPPVLRLVAPAPEELDALARSRRDMPLTYDDPGATRERRVPEGFSASEVKGALGTGERVWERACAAVDRWAMFDQAWIRLREPGGPPVRGRVVVFASHQLCLWAVNVCRVVYVVDSDDGRVARYGFGYGTVRPHGVAGEERFAVCWDRDTDEVWFDIWKFSRPAHLLVHLSGPIGRRIQQQFNIGAVAAMRAAIPEEQP